MPLYLQENFLDITTSIFTNHQSLSTVFRFLYLDHSYTSSLIFLHSPFESFLYLSTYALEQLKTFHLDISPKDQATSFRPSLISVPGVLAWTHVLSRLFFQVFVDYSIS